jgi:hypothetical protein
MKTPFIETLNVRRPLPVLRLVPDSASTIGFSIGGLLFNRIHGYPLKTSKNRAQKRGAPKIEHVGSSDGREFAASESGEYFADQGGTQTMQELAIIAEPRLQQLSAEVFEEAVRFMSGTLGCEPFFGRG